jgi:predicted transcriptional regulator
VDEHGRLTGVIRLADLLRAHPQEPLRTIAKAQIVSIGADQDQELAARLLNRYDLLALPVVDDQGRILGVITADDAMAVWSRRRLRISINGRVFYPPRSGKRPRAIFWYAVRCGGPGLSGCRFC